jgi:hypothetical protein
MSRGFFWLPEGSFVQDVGNCICERPWKGTTSEVLVVGI